jgi:transposase
MRAYSNDLRRRVIERIQENEESQVTIAEHFSVSISFVEKLWQRFRVTGSFEAKPHRGGHKRLLREHEALLRAEIKAKSDITLAELVEKVVANGGANGKLKVGITTMCDELQRLKLRRKKNGLRRGA